MAMAVLLLLLLLLWKTSCIEVFGVLAAAPEAAGGGAASPEQQVSKGRARWQRGMRLEVGRFPWRPPWQRRRSNNGLSVSTVAPHLVGLGESWHSTGRLWLG